MEAADFTTIVTAVVDQITLFIPLAAGLIALVWGVPKAFQVVKRLAK